MRTQEEITAEIAALNSLRERVPTHTLFGEDNQARIDAQIEVLQDEMDDDEIYDRWADVGEDPNETILSDALDALDWLNGDAPAPSADWADIAS